MAMDIEVIWVGRQEQILKIRSYLDAAFSRHGRA
jgi:hypothetical protein